MYSTQSSTEFKVPFVNAQTTQVSTEGARRKTTHAPHLVSQLYKDSPTCYHAMKRASAMYANNACVGTRPSATMPFQFATYAQFYERVRNIAVCKNIYNMYI